MSSAFSIGGINLRMLLRRKSSFVDDIRRQRFNFELEPVNKNDDEAKKAFGQKRCVWDVHNGKGIVSNFANLHNHLMV
jgi:hypothetical protein